MGDSGVMMASVTALVVARVTAGLLTLMTNL